MPSSIVHTLLPAGCLFSSQALLPKLSKKEWGKLFLLSCLLANFPDLDVIPATLSGNLWSSIHRNWGHNIFSVFFEIWMGTYLMKKFVSREISQKLSLNLSAILVLSHLLFDSMQGPNNDGEVIGIPLFFPFSTWQFTLPLKIFKAVSISHESHFLTGYLTSMAFWKVIIYWEFTYIFSFWILWNVLFTSGIYMVRLHKRKKEIQAALLSKEIKKGNAANLIL